MTAHDYHVGDRVQRVREHPLADYRPTGRRGTVIQVMQKPLLIRVRWDRMRGDGNPWPAVVPFPHLHGTTYYPDVLEPLSAVEQLGELGGEL
jgi:hypothetical protein